ncbi:MAG: segregation/condensation protein A [Candidatus Sungbacteria bacterium]|nr:segregation/condensation protein A [Candidatus Sungbacteria bacterium]
MVFEIRHEKFEGPLELLLELIEKEKLSISEISLSRVAEEYIEHVRSLERIDPEQLAEFLVVASQLMLIKSRSLLPNLSFSEEEEESGEELERRLAEYRKFRERAALLKKLDEARKPIFIRDAYLAFAPVFFPPPQLVLGNLAGAFRTFLAALPKVERLVQEKMKRIVSLEERMRQIRLLVHAAVERAFSEIIKGSGDKIDIIVSFLAILELAKQKFVDVRQEGAFTDIIIKRIV